MTLVVFKMDSNSFVALLHHVISKFDEFVLAHFEGKWVFLYFHVYFSATFSRLKLR